VLTDRLREALDSKVINCGATMVYHISYAHICPTPATTLYIFIAKSKQLPIPALKPLMEAIWTAEIRGMFRYYRIAVVLLADIGIDLNLGLTGLSWIEEIFPQVRRMVLWVSHLSKLKEPHVRFCLATIWNSEHTPV